MQYAILYSQDEIDRIGGTGMATSSITKEFTVKDEKAYVKLVKGIGNASERAIKVAKPSNLSLKDLLDSADDERKMACLLSALSMFRCAQDDDIASFLPNKAIDFLHCGLCSVYLILEEESFLQGKLSIEAYFTLSHKTLCVPEGMSKSKIKEIDGFKTATSLHFVLIGQLGNISFKKKTAPTYVLRSRVKKF